MTRHHYVAIAALLYARLERTTDAAAVRALAAVAHDLADYFAGDNPRFDRARFLAACGVAE